MLLLAGACAAGLVTGIAGKRLMRGGDSARPGRGDALAAGAADGTAPGVFSDGRNTNQAAERPRSTDTLDSLLSIRDGTLYQRLALWLMDASEAEIAAYWQACQKQDPSKRSRDINDLVFLNWTRLNPQGAIAGAGPGNGQYAWWAWTCHDPKAALAAAAGVGGDVLNHVTFGLGEFHPDWLREHIGEIPEDGKRKALQGMLKWDDQQDPLATLQFMKKNGIGATTGNIKALARHDPDQALAWVKEQVNQSTGALELIIQTLAAERPEDLQRLADGAPSGAMKVGMEAALFSNLIKTDPAAALEQARATTIPRIAAERYSALGLDVLKADPDKAFTYAKDLFTKCPDALRLTDRIEYPNGSSGSHSGSSGAEQLMEGLFARDPDRLLGLFLESPEKSSVQEISRFSYQWANRDLAGYTDWVNHQSDLRAREAGAKVISDRLADKGHFPEAAEWAMSGSPDNLVAIEKLITRWASADAAAPSAWIESSGLPADRKATLRARLSRQP